MHHTAVNAFVRNIQALAIVSLWGACGNGFAQIQFITPCQALLTVVNEEATRSTKIEAFELKISKTEDDKLIAQVQGETQIEFFYATQPSVLKQQKIQGMAVNIEKNLWDFQYQYSTSPTTARIHLSLNPISGAIRYSQVNSNHHTVRADGLCELPLQGKEAFIEAHSRITTP